MDTYTHFLNSVTSLAEAERPVWDSDLHAFPRVRKPLLRLRHIRHPIIRPSVYASQLRGALILTKF